MLNSISLFLRKRQVLYFIYFLFFLSFIFFIWFIFISDYFKDFLLSLEHFIRTKPQHAYLIAFLAAVCEGTIFLSTIPGTSYIVTMGVFLARGLVNPFLLFPIVIIGAFMGDLLGYSLGSFLAKYLQKKNFQNNEHYQLAQKFIKRHGGKSIFLARFVTGLKEIIPFSAGILNMPLKKFMIWNFLGAIGWAFFWIEIGFISGNFITKIENIVKAVGIAFLIFFSIMFYIFYKKHQKNK